MNTAFLALALAMALLAVRVLQHESARTFDAEVLDKAGRQRFLSQQLGRQAALLVAQRELRARHAEDLSQLLVHSRQDALELEGLLEGPVLRAQVAQRTVQPVLAAWQAARERLWYRAEIVARQAEHQAEDDLLRSTSALQAEVEPALAAAQRLAAELRGAAEARGRGLRSEVLWGTGALLALLGLLALLVVEPTARAVARQARRLAEQSAEVQRLALVAEHTNALVIVSDPHDRIRWVNPAFVRTTGWTLDEAVGRTALELLPSVQAQDELVARARQALRRGSGLHHEWLHRTRDGRELWLDVDLRPLRDAAGALIGFTRVASDVTARVQQQAKLVALWAALPAGVIVQAADGGVVDANPAAKRLLGLTLAQLQGHEVVDPLWHTVRDDLSAYPPADYPGMRTLRSGTALGNQTVGVRLPGHGLRWLLVNTEPLRGGTGEVTGVVSCISDITDRRGLQEQLSASARTDALTQLPNRTVVLERLQRAIEHARRHAGYGFAVLFMDFDRFKQVNDTLGHGAGDELLRQVAARLVQALRPGDALARLECGEGAAQDTAARMGGDEFVVVLEGVNDAETVTAITQRLLQELGEPYTVHNAPVHSSVSIGVVLSHAGGAGGTRGDDPQADAAWHDITAEQVLRNADTAMYEAKRAGRGRWVMFDNSMHERVVRVLAMESDLRRALKEDELFVVYQPVVCLRTRALTGVEALVRWRHPQRGLVSPADFIGVAEECGLIDAVGSIVLAKACEQFMRWRDELGDAAPSLLAVNLSRAQLKRAGLTQEVHALLQASGMPAAQLQLEVTESLAAQDEQVQATLLEIKKLGVTLALDDFGTGYSSLACLHQLPVDTVKIDRSFVSHAEQVEYHRVLIEATIRVARTLGMTTVAEGIETPGQADLMRALDCDRGQGYLFGRPLEAAALAAWARERGATSLAVG